MVLLTFHFCFPSSAPRSTRLAVRLIRPAARNIRLRHLLIRPALRSTLRRLPSTLRRRLLIPRRLRLIRPAAQSTRPRRRVTAPPLQSTRPHHRATARQAPPTLPAAPIILLRLLPIRPPLPNIRQRPPHIPQLPLAIRQVRLHIRPPVLLTNPILKERRKIGVNVRGAKRSRVTHKSNSGFGNKKKISCERKLEWIFSNFDVFPFSFCFHSIWT